MDKHTPQFWTQLWDAAVTFAGGLTPAGLGASVAVAYEKGLTWAEKFTQLAVGVIVSYFTTRTLDALWPLDPFVMQGVSFSVGMIAFKSAPRFIAGAAEVIGSLPAFLRDRILALLPGRKEGK
jgi:predicted anti-sigma-YlaC factor YlaD